MEDSTGTCTYIIHEKTTLRYCTQSSTMLCVLQLKRVDVPICDLVLRLTMPGTPSLIYGDEIGLTGLVNERGYMLWDDTALHGFTENSTFQLPADQSAGSSVLVGSLSLLSLSLDHSMKS